jgi:hypothetical protein
MTSVEIYKQSERPQTLADISFAPTSIAGIEFPDDTEPIVFEVNRAAMEELGKAELKELEALNQQTTVNLVYYRAHGTVHEGW